MSLVIFSKMQNYKKVTTWLITQRRKVISGCFKHKQRVSQIYWFTLTINNEKTKFLLTSPFLS